MNRAVWLIGLAAMAISVLSAPVAGAFPTAVPRRTWAPNGRTDAIVAAGDRVYLGGGFDYVGPDTGYGVSLSTSTGGRLQRFPRVNGEVDAVIGDGRGGWFIAGSFTHVGRLARTCLAHIRA